VAAVLAVAVVLSAVGAVAWSRLVTDDGGDRVDVRLDEPGEYVDPAAPANPTVAGERLPVVELLAADGASTPLVTDGRPMVVNLWYSACAPCARELADFASVESALGEEIRFVGVNPLDSFDVMQRFAEERDVGYELLRDADFAFTDELGVVAFPATLFVDPDGTVVGQDGVLDQASLRHHLDMHWGIGA